MRALSRWSLSVSSSIVFSFSSTVLSVPLKSKRVATSRLGLIDRVADLLQVDFGDDVEAGHGRCRTPRVRGEKAAANVAPGSVPEWPKGTGCKPVAQATLVRIQPGPPYASAARSGGVAAGVARSWLPAPTCEPRSEHPLHQDDVEPAAELAADLALDADRLEAARARAARSTRRGRRRCARRPSGSRGRRRAGRARRAAARPTPAPRRSRCDVDRVLDGRARTPAAAGTGVSEPKPDAPSPASSTATIAGWPPECSSIHASCSSRVRGTRSNVTVDSSDLEVVDRADRLGVAALGRAGSSVSTHRADRSRGREPATRSSRGGPARLSLSCRASPP